MRKIAVFVEGQTELIVTREFILKTYQYQDVRVGCYNLLDGTTPNPAPYPFGPKGAPIYYQINNVGGDVNVLETILEQEAYLFSEGKQFNKIVGLRDMFSEDYVKTVKNRTIDPKLNQQFIKGVRLTINEMAIQSDKIAFQFAIMETEAWFLGMEAVITKLNETLNAESIQTKIGYSLAEIDPETTVFHPARTLNDIFSLFNQKYKKRQEQVDKIMGQVQLGDIKTLYQSSKCPTFTQYCDALELPIRTVT